MFDLQGRIALVTGSTRGIGRVAAQALASRGATVMINGRDEAKVQEVVEQGKSLGLDLRALPFDAGDLAAGLKAVARAEQEVGPVDILFANAGIQHRQPLLDFPLTEFERVLTFNLTAQWALGQRVARGMVARGHGRIIFTGSITALMGRERVTAYSASKGALHALVRQWSAELAMHGVTVNAVAPGYIQTELTRALWQDPEFDGWLRQRTPAGRWGQPDDLAAAVVFLASDEAGYITGQVLTVDGGLTATM